MPEHRDGRTTDTRQLILKEAEKLYYAGGYDNINLQVLADHLKITKAALFHHFKNKQALFFEMLLSVVEQMRQMFEAMINEGDQSSYAKLSRIMMRWAQEPTFDIMRFQREEFVLLDPGQQQAVGKAWEAGMLEVLKCVFREGIQRGDLQDHDVTMSAYLFLNACVLLPHVDNPMHNIMGYANQEQYITNLLRILMSGLAKKVSDLA